MACFPGEYYLSLVVSTKAHAKILNVDPSEALRMPGIVDYISWKDIPAQNKAGTVISDEKVFAVDMVREGHLLSDLFKHFMWSNCIKVM